MESQSSGFDPDMNLDFEFDAVTDFDFPQNLDFKWDAVTGFDFPQKFDDFESPCPRGPRGREGAA